MMRNPYKIDGPAIISFSGGRTSGFMLYQILEAHGGKLPDDVIVSFQNTGKEMPETLDFIQECSDRWNVPIVWLEYDYIDNKHSFKIVNHNSASRNGEPFAELISHRKMLPNPVTRYCTQELKIRIAKKYCKQILGWKHWDNIIGLRADEPRRVSRATAPKKEIFETLAPMAEAQHDVSHVFDFWKRQPFDLNLPNNNGKTPLGNCDLCFLKGASTIAGIVRDYPDLAKWWADMESEKAWDGSAGHTFRKDRPSYQAMLDMSRTQGDFFSEWPDEPTIPCMCTD